MIIVEGSKHRRTESLIHSKGRLQRNLLEMEFPSHFLPPLYQPKPKAKLNYFVFMDQAWIMVGVDEIDS